MEQSQKEILEQIAKLKLQHPLSDKDKLKLQRLQQKTQQLMNAEDYLYEAHALGIKDEVFAEVKKIRETNPHMELDDVYQNALNTVKKNK